MTSTTNQTHRLIGSLRRIDDARGAIRIEDVYDTDIDDLWSALTEPERLARWIATVEGDLRLGGSFNVRFTSTWEGPGRIDVCDSPHRLLLTMEPGSSDEAVIEAVLSAEGQATRLVIEERGLPLSELHLHGAGWQAHAEDLATLIAGREPGPWRDRWVQLCPAYEALAQALR